MISCVLTSWCIAKPLDLKKMYDTTRRNTTLLGFFCNYFLTTTKNYFVCTIFCAWIPQQQPFHQPWTLTSLPKSQHLIVVKMQTVTFTSGCVKFKAISTCLSEWRKFSLIALSCISILMNTKFKKTLKLYNHLVPPIGMCPETCTTCQMLWVLFGCFCQFLVIILTTHSLALLGGYWVCQIWG